MTNPKEKPKQEIKFTKKHFSRNKIYEAEIFRYISTLDKNKFTKNEKQLIGVLKASLTQSEFQKGLLGKINNSFKSVFNVGFNYGRTTK